jgi:hypothetical protein
MARIRLSLYIDDRTIFLNPVRHEVDLIMAIMQRLDDAACLRINVAKSTAAPTHCSEINLDEVLQNFTGGRVFFFPHHIPWNAYHTWAPESRSPTTSPGPGNGKDSGLAREDVQLGRPQEIG